MGRDISTLRRGSAAAVTAALVGVFVVACGTSNTSSGGRDQPINEAGTKTYAQSVNLRAADVAGLDESRLPLTRATDFGPLGRLGEACAGEGYTRGKVSGAVSKRFTSRLAGGSFNPEESVASGVYLFGSAALARQEVAVLASFRARACLARYNYGQVTTTKSQRSRLYSNVVISPLASAAGGAPATGWRVTAVLAAFLDAAGVKGQRNYYEEFLAFAVDRAVITLRATGSPHPFSAQRVQRLLSLLHGRAVANARILRA